MVEAKPPEDLVIYLTRQPFDDYFRMDFTKDGRKVSEELEPEETRQWFKDHGVTDKDALEKLLDECWNFYESKVRIPGRVYKEPVKPFPQYQPQV